jgi:DNA-binding CsgD family transcriptional regulator
VSHFEVPFALVSLSTYVVIAANEAFLERVAKSSKEVVGHPGSDLFTGTDRENSLRAVQALQHGAVDFYTAERELSSSSTPQRMVSLWVRAIDFGEGHSGLVFINDRIDSPGNPLVQHLGFSPLEMAVGLVNAQGIVSSISCDITTILKIPADEIVGKPLARTVEQESLCKLIDLGRRERYSVSMRVWLRGGDNRVKEFCCIVTSLVDSPELSFILVPVYEPAAPSDSDRVAQLEQHLWRIAGEVQASGILRNVRGMPDAKNYPILNSLSTRQWDVLSRLLRGQRVPAIAKALFVSQSTVRNTLSSIFRRFGVHSQAQLLELLNEADGSSRQSDVLSD